MTLSCVLSGSVIKLTESHRPQNTQKYKRDRLEDEGNRRGGMVLRQGMALKYDLCNLLLCINMGV